MKISVNKACVWNYSDQPPLNTKILLLTKDNQCLVGPWKGEPIGQNKTYKAWQGLPDRDKTVETAMGYR